MKFRLLLLFWLCGPLLAAENADAAYDELRQLMGERPPTGLSREESIEHERRLRDQASRLAESFAATYPDHPKKWEAVAWAIMQPRRFSGPEAEAEGAAWEERRQILRRELLAAPDVAVDVWVGVAERKIYEETGWRGQTVGDLAQAEAMLDEIARRAPDSSRRKFVEQQFLEVQARSDPAAAEARARRLAAAAATNAEVAQMAAGVLAVNEARRIPLDLKFVAADGREVDLAALRGKVVLIDFWATWCKPCMDEMPNVIRVYEAYRAQGFEVIGISFDKAPGAAPRAFEKTAAQVVEFARANGMSWPHHYDGEYWANEIGRRFAIRVLPTVFLLDREGRLVSTEAKGAKLEPAVRKLLGLPPAS